MNATNTMQRTGDSSPVEIQSAADLLRKMRAGVKDVHDVRMRELVIPMRILSQDEWNDIRRDAKMNTLAKGLDDIDYNVMVMKSVLKVASTVKKEGGGPMLSDKLLTMLNQDEMSYLYNEYLRVVDSINPNIEHMTDVEFRHLVDMIKKNIISSRDCSLSQLRAIFYAYQEMVQAVDLAVSQQGNSSGGSQPTSP